MTAGAAVAAYVEGRGGGGAAVQKSVLPQSRHLKPAPLKSFDMLAL